MAYLPEKIVETIPEEAKTLELLIKDVQSTFLNAQ